MSYYVIFLPDFPNACQSYLQQGSMGFPFPIVILSLWGVKPADPDGDDKKDEMDNKDKKEKRYKDDDNAGGVSSSRLSIMGGVNYVVCLKQQQSPITNFHRHFVPH